MDSLNEIKELLTQLPPREKLETLIELGKELAEFPEEDKTEENKVPGCISTAYLKVEVKDNKVNLSGYSDALTIRGYLAILIKSLSEMEINDFLNNAENKVKEFIQETKLQSSLTPSRANTLGNILKMMIDKVRKLKC